MSIMETIKKKAMAQKMRVVLPEGTEERTIQAAAIIAKEGLADVTLLGNPDAVKQAARGADLSGTAIVDPATDARFKAYAEKLYELRKEKGVTMEKAEALMKDEAWWQALSIPRGTRSVPHSKSSRPHPAYRSFPAVSLWSCRTQSWATAAF